MIKFIFSVILVIGVVAGIIVILGYISNPTYTGTIQFNVETRPPFVWQELVRIEDVPQKKSDVVTVSIISTQGQLVAWREELKNGGYRVYRMNEYITNKRLIIELIESSYGLTGTWEIILEPEEYSTRVTINEKSALDNIQKRGVRTLFGRNYDLLVWLKYIRVGIVENLLKTP